MIVTRFAPSPTGYLHVGGARTALFNWLLARSTGGKFILRIEDTDLKRNTPTATEQVIRDLNWLGLEWDEGPKVGGPSGPYNQSQRLDIYNHYVKLLIDMGKAYYAFETTQELKVMRDESENSRGFLYPRPAVFPSHAEAEQAKAQGKSVVVRFAMPDEEIVVYDEIRGEVRFASKELGDFIIRKSDGFPTYNFACVIDDELMGVTHVIRGQEHLMNTPSQQAVGQVLGFRRQKYAHMSVTISESGGKLSKRERPKVLKEAIGQRKGDIDLAKLAKAGGISVGEVEEFVAGKTVPDMPVIDAMASYMGVALPEINVVDFFRSGYLPETMINFMGLLGWSTGSERDVMMLDEQIRCFDISRFGKSNSLFDRKKLLAFNTEHMRMVPAEKLLEHFKKYLAQVGSVLVKADDKLLAKMLEICKGARTLAEVEFKCRFLCMANDAIEYDEKAVNKVLLKSDGLAILKTVRDKLAAMTDISEEKIENMLRSLAEESGVGLGKVAQPLRVALCGGTISPSMFDSVQLLGMENTLARIDATLEKFGKEGKN